MTTYNTGNPIGSTAVKDLYDNAENLDVLVNDKTKEAHPDRLGQQRKTWHGMEQDFQRFLINSGYQDIGSYAAGLEITARNQIFWRDGELYRASAALELPYTTTGNWATEGGSFVAVGDAALRQDIKDALIPGNGASMVGYRRAAYTPPTNVNDVLRSQAFNIQADGGASPGDDVTALINQILAEGEKSIRIPPGVWKMSGTLLPGLQDTHIFGDGFNSILEFTDVPLCVDMSKNRMRMSSLTIKVNGEGTALLIKASPPSPQYNFDNAISNVLFTGDYTKDNLGIDLQSYINTFYNCHIINFRTLVKFGDESNRNTFLGCTLRSEHTAAGTPDDSSLLVMDSGAGTGNAFIGCDIEGTPYYYLIQNGGQVAFQGGYFEGAMQAAAIQQPTEFSGASCALRDVFYSGGIALPNRGNSLVIDHCELHGPFSTTWTNIQNFHGYSMFGSFEVKNVQKQPYLIRVAMGGHSDSYGIFDGLTGTYSVRPDKFEYLDIFTRGLVIHNRGTDQAKQVFAPLRMQGPYMNGLTSEREKYIGEIPAGACKEWPVTEQSQDANYSIEVRTLRSGQAINAFDVSTIHVWTGSDSGGQFEAVVDKAVAGGLVQVSAEVKNGWVTLKVCNTSSVDFSFYAYAVVRGCVALN